MLMLMLKLKPKEETARTNDYANKQAVKWARNTQKTHTQKTAKNKKEKPKRKTRNENMEKDTQFSTALGEWENGGAEKGEHGVAMGHGNASMECSRAAHKLGSGSRTSNISKVNIVLALQYGVHRLHLPLLPPSSSRYFPITSCLHSFMRTIS